ncbi:prolyl oligopeptidase family serine peptidase [Flavobacterium sp.]|uniref:prolyl oligopeptidase family serine peptidase n=1 Tax=Flavobacterium sp. TaxID=239 RepID=UPI0012228E4F|nr:prolyl oligopeptidase family serine peptidase [Flavobacterium sp.]RZJ69071.1 MAG: S9 family peptidase [Flavobacterium sp.]
MKKLIFIVPLLSAACFSQYKYPQTKTVTASDTYFGVKVNDPYRWLEDVKNDEVSAWLKNQDAYTESVLNKIPNQDKIVKELVAYEQIGADRYSPLGKAGGRYFYTKRVKGEQVAKLYYREGTAGPEILLFDPTKFINGKVMDFQAELCSDGSKVILNMSEQGSETGDVRILDVRTIKILPDVLPHSEGYFMDGSNSTIFYAQYKSYDVHDPENRLNMPLKRHKIGTPVSSDIVLASAKKYPELGIKPHEMPILMNFKESPYVFLGKMNVDNHMELYIAPISELEKPHVKWKPFAKRSDEIWRFFPVGDDVYLYTSKDNSRFRLLKTSAKNPDFSKAKEVLSGNADWKLSEVSQAKDYLIISKSRNELIFEPWAYNMKTGELKPIKTPLKGNAEASAVSSSYNEIKFINSEWNIPLDYYHYDLDKNEFSNGPFHSGISVPNIENVVYEEVEIPSHDGTMVPLSIVYDKSKLSKDGSNIAMMYGYGSYGRAAYLPTFSTTMLPLLNRGVVIAFAHIRGGGEKGQEWYLAGKKTTKPNTWKDFNACAEYLIDNKYTSSQKLGISGASAGGILIGRAITERPDLYKVAIPKVGCLNALRMEFSANGPGNIPEFGTVAIEEEFKALMEMDAYQHVQSGINYPAQLVTTGFNDSRVDSFIPAKFAAMMQSRNGSKLPVLLDVDYKAGHFGGSTLDEKFAQNAREFAFLMWQCGDPEFQSN